MMKKLCPCLVMVMMLFLVACAVPTNNNGTNSAATQEIASGVSITGLSYPQSGTAADFRIEGTLSAPTGLVKVTCDATLENVDAGIVVFNDAAEEFRFEEGVSVAELSELTAYFAAHMADLETTYQDAADIPDEENSVDVTLNCVCYDANGDSASFTICYALVPGAGSEVDSDSSVD